MSRHGRRLRLRPLRALSSAGERFPDTEEVTGSIPVAPTDRPHVQRLYQRLHSADLTGSGVSTRAERGHLG
jgi:hypothetical protein